MSTDNPRDTPTANMLQGLADLSNQQFMERHYGGQPTEYTANTELATNRDGLCYGSLQMARTFSHDKTLGHCSRCLRMVAINKDGDLAEHGITPEQDPPTPAQRAAALRPGMCFKLPGEEGGTVQLREHQPAPPGRDATYDRWGVVEVTTWYGRVSRDDRMEWCTAGSMLMFEPVPDFAPHSHIIASCLNIESGSGGYSSAVALSHEDVGTFAKDYSWRQREETITVTVQPCTLAACSALKRMQRNWQHDVERARNQARYQAEQAAAVQGTDGPEWATSLKNIDYVKDKVRALRIAANRAKRTFGISSIEYADKLKQYQDMSAILTTLSQEQLANAL